MKFLKSKGQHVLIDRRILKRIVGYAELSKNDVVLEVGCGTGNLTKLLLKKVQVHGIEIDARFVEMLRRKFRSEIEAGRFNLIHGNALRVEFPPFTKFVSNIPYNISSPLTFKLLKHPFKLAIVMYQREFAERLVAKAGSKSYGRLSVVAKAYCRAEILEVVPQSAFKPKPEVESAIVKLIPEPEIRVQQREVFEDLVKSVFSCRRKMLGKSIEEWSRTRGLDVDMHIENIKRRRPEEIEAEVYAKIADSVKLQSRV
jgi:16S rRNA (adenine1518-N6/adenine1519-N6)-dimethyltransferase